MPEAAATATCIAAPASEAKSPAAPPAVRTQRRKRRRRILLALAAAPLLAAGAFFAVFDAAVALCPYPAGDASRPPPAHLVLDRRGKALAAFVAPDGQWRFPMRYRQVSPWLLKAVVAVEDSRFYQHGGVDWLSVLHAAEENLLAGHIVRGASTLTMQLQRLRRPRKRSYTNKFWQAVRAQQIAACTSRKQILLAYLNRAPFGGNIVGAQAASWLYFDRPCKTLTLAQAALLAGLPQNPARDQPVAHPRRALARRAHVLRRMLALHMVSAAQCASALRQPLGLLRRPLPQMTGRPYAFGALPALVRLAACRPAAIVHTTLDLAVEQDACRLLRRQLRRLKSRGVRAGAVVVVANRHVACRAAVSVAPRQAAVDFTSCMRSTGSALKPFLYAQAFRGTLRPATLLPDLPAAWPGYFPQDYDHRFFGWIPAAEALAQSRNIPALLVLRHIGMRAAVERLVACGISSVGARPDQYGLPLAIGGAEASPLELAEAYATLANGGLHRPLEFIPGRRAATRVFPRAVCRQVLAALSGRRRTAYVCPAARAMRVAWKTGTSSNHCDAWCAAVTRRYTVVVWLGNGSGRGSRALVGDSAAAPVALRLEALLLGRGHNARWRQRSTPAPHAPIALRRRPPLAIVLPANHSIIYLLHQPRAQQRVLLRCIGGRGRRRWWFIDDKLLQAKGHRAWYTPVPGNHTVRVVNAAGQGAAATINVLRGGRAGSRGG